MTITRSIVLVPSRDLFLGGLLIALLALSAQEVRPQDCIPGWETNGRRLAAE
jgi:hypothetical protein